MEKKIHVYRVGNHKKTAVQKSITDFFKDLSTKKSTPFESKNDDTKKAPVQKILADFFYTPLIDKPNYPLVEYKPPKKEEHGSRNDKYVIWHFLLGFSLCQNSAIILITYKINWCVNYVY